MEIWFRTPVRLHGKAIRLRVRLYSPPQSDINIQKLPRNIASSTLFLKWLLIFLSEHSGHGEGCFPILSCSLLLLVRTGLPSLPPFLTSQYLHVLHCWSHSPYNMDASNSTHLDPKDVVNNFFRNIDIHLKDYAVSEPRTSKSKFIFVLKSFYILGYNAFYSVKSQMAFRRNISPPYSWWNKPSKKPAWSR
jgi:hypothetical protein